jgi:hypothetical protein
VAPEAVREAVREAAREAAREAEPGAADEEAEEAAASAAVLEDPVSACPAGTGSPISAGCPALRPSVPNAAAS